MNLSQRLRTCAKHTGLDAVIELLTEAADEIERLSAGQPADVTDEQIKELIPDGDGWKFEVGFDEAIKFARAILALRPVQVPMTDERSVSVKVDRELFSFHSEQDWVNKARSRYANCGVQKGHYITVDAAGHVMHMGLCFKHAAYPVTVYQLQTNWPKEQA